MVMWCFFTLDFCAAVFNTAMELCCFCWKCKGGSDKDHLGRYKAVSDNCEFQQTEPICICAICNAAIFLELIWLLLLLNMLFEQEHLF